MKQIDEMIYKNGKFLTLKSSYKNEVNLKNAWYDRSDMRKIPSVIIYKGSKYDQIDYDINPLGNIVIINSDEIWNKVEELVKKNLEKWKKYNYWTWKSWLFKISCEKSEKVAEELYDLLLKFIK